MTMEWRSIQYLRAFAVLIVVWHHACEQLTKLAGGVMPAWLDGRAGVDLFFVISGFIMWTTTQARPPDPREFWRRRVIRIVPTYWLFTLLLVAVMAEAPGLFAASHLAASHVILSLLFVPHYHPFEPDRIYPLLSFGWTLNFEMFFYLVFGGALLLRERWRLAAVAGLFVLLVAAGLAHHWHNALAVTFTSPLLLEFVLGLAIGQAITGGWRPRAIPAGALALAGLVGLAGIRHCLGDPSEDLRVLYWGLPAAALVAGAVGLERAIGVARLRLAHLLGDASYAIYLSHLFTLGLLHWLWPRLPLVDRLPGQSFVAAALIASSAGGILAYLAIERPAGQFLRRRHRRPAPVVATAALAP